MQYIDPELLSNARPSPYRSAVENGYGGLRFEASIEGQFNAFNNEAHLTRSRLAGYLALAMFALFVLIDLNTLPPQVAAWTVGIRVGLIIPSFIIGLVISYRLEWRHLVPRAILCACLITGLGTVALIGIALHLGFPIRYEGILLVALFIYLIVCMQWRRALLVNLATLFAFVCMEMIYQTDHQARLYEIVFMFAANAIGACGGYFLEYSNRTNFLVHALLYELAERDGLTGLYNRRTLNTHLERVWRQARRSEQELLAVAMIDIDFFKRYNDHYGHAQGDAALQAVADAIGAVSRRPLDLAARYGGEEFVVLWYNPAPAELAGMADNVLEAVRALQMVHADSEFGNLTVSVGVALIQPASVHGSAELLRRADEALYQAKHQGRNRCVVQGLPNAAATVEQHLT